MNVNVSSGEAASATPVSATQRYDGVAMSLHWIIFLLVVGMATLGFFLDGWPKAGKDFVVNIHGVVGLTLFALVLLRLFWRIGHKPPELPAGIDAFSKVASNPVHMLIYALLVAIPVVGFVAYVWHGRAFNFGLFNLDFGVKSQGPIYHPAEDIHGYLVYGLLALVTLHGLAALWHHFIRKDGVLLRMMPGGK